MYGEEAVETVENAVEMALESDGAEDITEAVRFMAASYTGHDVEHGNSMPPWDDSDE